MPEDVLRKLERMEESWSFDFEKAKRKIVKRMDSKSGHYIMVSLE